LWEVDSTRPCSTHNRSLCLVFRRLMSSRGFPKSGTYSRNVAGTVLATIHRSRPDAAIKEAVGETSSSRVRFSSLPTASPRFEFANGNDGFTSNTLWCVPGDGILLRKNERISGLFLMHNCRQRLSVGQRKKCPDGSSEKGSFFGLCEKPRWPDELMTHMLS
jgi:hypothetical protein